MKETPVIPNVKRPTPPWIKGVSLIVGVIVLIILMQVSCAFLFDTVWSPHPTYPAPGEDNSRFDPIAAIPAIQTQIGESPELMSLRSTYVKSDGTQDLTTEIYNARTTYEFVREVPEPDNAPPIGAGGSADGKWYQVTGVDIFRPGQWRSVSGSENYTYQHKGMDLDNHDARGTKPETLAIPRCSFATLWQQAIQDGIPDSAVASISYDAEGYDFSISDLAYYAEFNQDCELVSN
jgi:hypothetical protein